MQSIQLGRRLLPLARTAAPAPHSVQRLQPGNALLGQPAALRAQLEDHGYVYLQQLIPRDKVLRAGQHVLAHLAQLPGVLQPPWQRGVLAENCGAHCLPFLEGRNAVSHAAAVLDVLEGPELRAFFDGLFAAPSRTFDFKWLRCVHRKAYTGAHADSVYMGRGSQRLLTCWIPLLDTPMEMGTLAVLDGSHRLPAYQQLQNTYANMDVEKANLDGTGWFTEDPLELTEQFGGVWRTTDFEAGDVMVFGMRTLHMSSTNQTDRVRISCDTRWQPASDPIDSRYVGELQGHGNAKFGLAKAGKKATAGVSIDELKQQWGFKPWPADTEAEMN